MNKIILLVVLIGVCFSFYASAKVELTVRTARGRYKGFQFPNGARAFLGIPFAQPPVGALRWAPPLPAKKISGTFDATVSGPCCPQSGLFKNLTVAESEDCLTLDIYTPKNTKKGDKLPVKVYIHGGGFAANSAALYPGDQLAQNTSSVVVIINYRLSYQGFVVFTPLLAENNNVVNNGLRDQQLALQWIQKYINSFGGDKDNVLIFGNSAGGMSVLMHYTFPSSKNLFKVGVAESAGPWDYITAENAARINDPLAARFGCYSTGFGVNMTCLRAVPITTFYNFTWAGTQPTVDGLFTGPIAPTFKSQAKMSKAKRGSPIIIGNSKHEGNQFAWLALRIVTKNLHPPLNATFPQYFGILNSSLPFTQPVVQEIANYYANLHLTEDGNYFVALREALGDFGIKCGNALTAYNGITGLAEEPKKNEAVLGKVYNYYFSHDTEDWRYTFLNATHTVEIPYLFLTNGTVFETKFTVEERALANRLANYLDNFLENGNPNGENFKKLAKWPSLKTKKNSTLAWDLTNDVIGLPIPEACTKYFNDRVVNQVVTRDSQKIFNYEKFITDPDAIALNLFHG